MRKIDIIVLVLIVGNVLIYTRFFVDGLKRYKQGKTSFRIGMLFEKQIYKDATGTKLLVEACIAYSLSILFAIIWF